jgi:hypothetical protein
MDKIKEAHKLLTTALPPRLFEGATFELVKVREAAEMCGLNEKTLRERIRKGLLPAWGKPLRVRWRDVLTPFNPASALSSGPKTDQN